MSAVSVPVHGRMLAQGNSWPSQYPPISPALVRPALVKERSTPLQDSGWAILVHGHGTGASCKPPSLSLSQSRAAFLVGPALAPPLVLVWPDARLPVYAHEAQGAI